MSEPSESRAVFTIAKAMAQSTSSSSVTVELPITTAKVSPSLRGRSFAIPAIIVFGITALLATIGIYRLERVGQPGPPPQAQVQGSAQPDLHEKGLNKLRSSFENPPPEQVANRAVNPFKSFALDVAQLYVAITNFPKAKIPPPTAGRAQEK
jgi:hypothetical protein